VAKEAHSIQGTQFRNAMFVPITHNDIYLLSAQIYSYGILYCYLPLYVAVWWSATSPNIPEFIGLYPGLAISPDE
jgi:hypothetical protein